MEFIFIDIFAIIIFVLIGILIGSIIRTNNNNNNDNNNDKCYNDGELDNICTIIALKNIKREMKNMLSNVEKDALDKAIKNTISIENVYNFINLKNSIDNDMDI